MRLLPDVPTPAGLLRLPMSDRSATQLVVGILSGQPGHLLSALECDPPLVLWAVVQAAARGQCEFASLWQLSEWLSRHALDVLQWPESAEAGEALRSAHATELAEQVIKDIRRARLASLTVSAHGPAPAAEAFMLGLLADARRWVQVCLERSDTSSPPEEDICGAVLPKPLADRIAGQSPVATAVRSAAQAADDGEWPAISPVATDNCISQSLDAASRWAERLPGPGDFLHVLTARLARLEDLETRFQAALEAEKLASLAEFAAGAGHEINNPLTVIAGRAQMLLQSETHPQRRRDLATIHAQAMRVYEMIADMRLFARPPKPQLEPIELAAVIQRAVESLQEQADQQQTQIVSRLPDEPLTVQADPTQLVVALRALLQNSLEALGHGGQVEIAAAVVPPDRDRTGRLTDGPSASPEQHAASPEDHARPVVPPAAAIGSGGTPRQVEIIVADNGPGITPEERRHIFDPFFSARQAGRGLGMGLSKCWRIVTNHGGSIAVESQPGQGATFRIRLPAVV